MAPLNGIAGPALPVPPVMKPIPAMRLKIKYIPKQTALKQNVPPNVLLPANLVITFYENMAFLATSLQIPLAMLRFLQNGAPTILMARVQLHAANELSSRTVDIVNQRLKYQQHGAISSRFGTKSGMKSQLATTPYNDLTTASWVTRDDYKKSQGARGFFGHVQLKELSKTVPPARWPTGNDRGDLTVND